MKTFRYILPVLAFLICSCSSNPTVINPVKPSTVSTPFDNLPKDANGLYQLKNSDFSLGLSSWVQDNTGVNFTPVLDGSGGVFATSQERKAGYVIEHPTFRSSSTLYQSGYPAGFYTIKITITSTGLQNVVHFPDADASRSLNIFTLNTSTGTQTVEFSVYYTHQFNNIGFRVYSALAGVGLSAKVDSVQIVGYKPI